MSVLVVDDNPADQHLVADHLGKIRSFKCGMELDFAKDGMEVLAKLRTKNFDLVILDWELQWRGNLCSAPNAPDGFGGRN